MLTLQPSRLYHIYNRGNNRKPLFYTDWNYALFLRKFSRYVNPYCDLLAYSLMPNHFHFLIHANESTILPWSNPRLNDLMTSNPSRIQMSQFSHGIQMLLSSYAKCINHQYKRTGSLFTQNTHAVQTSDDLHLLDYSLWCFIYIHNNPVKAGLVSSPEKWPYSSYQEYLGKVKEPLCNLELGKSLLSLNINKLSSYDQLDVPDYIVSQIF